MRGKPDERLAGYFKFFRLRRWAPLSSPCRLSHTRYFGNQKSWVGANSCFEILEIFDVHPGCFDFTIDFDFCSRSCAAKSAARAVSGHAYTVAITISAAATTIGLSITTGTAAVSTASAAAKPAISAATISPATRYADAKYTRTKRANYIAASRQFT